jgi:membrane protease YdiL (CAAX protease family)
MDLLRNPATGDVRSGWKALGWILLLGVGLIPLALLASLIWGRQQGMLPQQLVAIGAALFATWLALKAEGRPLAAVGLRFNDRWFGELGLGVLLGAAVMAVGAAALAATGAIHWEARPGVGWGPVATGFGLFLLVGISEELTFRGYFFQQLLKGLGTWPGQALGGFIFAYVHWGNPGMTHPTQKLWATVNITLAGVLLGLAYVRTRSLALPIGIHLGWNWVQGCVLGFAVSGTTDLTGPFQVVVDPAKAPWFTGGTFGLEASVFGTGACALAIVGLAVWKGVSADPSTDAAPADPP